MNTDIYRMNPARLRRRRGASTVLVLMVTGALSLVTVSLGSISVTAMRLTSNGRDKAISLSLAEAGIDEAVDRLRITVLANQDNRDNWYSGTGGSEVTVKDAEGNTAGTYNVRVLPVLKPGSTTEYSDNLLDVYSTGTTTNRFKREVRARVNLSGLSGGGGAMLSNGDIYINGSVTVQTEPLELGTANVRANGNITGSGSAAFVDGRVSANGTATIPFNTSDKVYPKGQSNAPRIPFPSESTINAWITQWRTEALTGLNLSGGINGSSSLPLGISLSGGSVVLSNKTLTIKAPAYIIGDIDLQGNDKLRIEGTGPVYVTGNVSMKGNSVMENSATLVVRGKFSQVGSTIDSPIYEAKQGAGPTPPALISLSTDLDDAISLTGTATNNDFSVIYAVRGGVDVNGNVKVRGALMAGGVGATISAKGNYTHTYPDDAVQNVRFAVSPTVVSWIELSDQGK